MLEYNKNTSKLIIKFKPHYITIHVQMVFILKLRNAASPRTTPLVFPDSGCYLEGVSAGLDQEVLVGEALHERAFHPRARIAQTHARNFPQIADGRLHLEVPHERLPHLARLQELRGHVLPFQAVLVNHYHQFVFVRATLGALGGCQKLHHLGDIIVGLEFCVVLNKLHHRFEAFG